MEVYDYIGLKAYDEIHALDTAEKKGAQKAKIEIAKNLLDVLDDETISLKTGLDKKTIENLRGG
jgi:hypothetical protein